MGTLNKTVQKFHWNLFMHGGRGGLIHRPGDVIHSFCNTYLFSEETTREDRKGGILHTIHISCTAHKVN